VRAAGWELARGTRTVVHPVRPAGPWASLRAQRGTADDALLRALHGPRWRDVTDAGRGRTAAHVATVAAGLLALIGAAAAVVARDGTRAARSARGVAAVATASWAALTLDFAARRLARGPRPAQDGWLREWLVMGATSPLIPWLAVGHRARAAVRHRRGVPSWPVPVRAVLFDRDGTLLRDVPYNGDPELVDPLPGARAAVELARAAGAAVGLVTNQSGVARGLLERSDVDAVNDRLRARVGELDAVAVCPHGPDDGCDCRKPAAGLVLHAARELGVAQWECAVIGDVAADVDAAIAAGAVAVLVPNPATRADEVADALESVIVAGDVVGAVRLALARPVAAGPAGGAR
jgi:histidinol-phosphate phosphatase family protein